MHRMRLRGVLRTATLAALSIACHHAGAARPKVAQLPDAFWENTEGIREDGAPPLFRAARAPESALLAKKRSTLVVHIMRAYTAPLQGAEVQLFPNPWWRDVVRRDTARRDGTLVFTDLEPRDYTGFVRCSWHIQQLFRLTLTPGFADTLLLNMGFDYDRMYRERRIPPNVPCTGASQQER
jgi:hypothetical protein